MRRREWQMMRVLICLLGLLALTSAARASGGGGARAGTPAEQAYVAARRVQVSRVEANAFSRARAVAETGTASAATTRPSAVDNSTLKWFPPIGNQGYQNSCVPWAAGYYYNTYTQAADADLDASSGQTDRLCSPAFLYALVNNGIDNGAYLDYTLARMNAIGCSTLALAPYDESDSTTWPSEAAWVDALSRRTQNLYSISASTTSGLESVRQLLANGRLVVAQFSVFGNFYYSYPNAPGIYNQVLYRADGPYIFDHAVALVGYDDTRAYFDDRDFTVHQGAFLAANSWGDSWGVSNEAGKQGFFWIAYAAFQDPDALAHDVLYTDDRADYHPLAYARVALNHAQRGDLRLLAGVGLPSAPKALTDPVLDDSGGTALGVTSDDAIAVDLTDLLGDLPAGRLADLFVSLTVSSSAASSGSLSQVDIYSDLRGTGHYTTTAVPHLPTTVAAGGTAYGFLPLFSDLTWDNWAYNQIEACYEAGVVAGYYDGTYEPEVIVSRDQMAVYVSRALLGDANIPAGPDTPTFSDVPTSQWAYRYIECAASQHIVYGYYDGTYGPDLPVDRGQMAVFMSRSIVSPTGDDGLANYSPPATPTFPDVPLDYWAFRYVEYLADPARGVVSGYSDGCYHPEISCTRDQMAVYVARAFGLTY